jgi:hypothetical protein
MNVVAFDGTVVVLSEERWRHVVLRHPELKNRCDLVLDVVRRPDEAYVDMSEGVHVLRRLVGEVSDFFVIIFVRAGEKGYKNGLLH